MTRLALPLLVAAIAAAPMASSATAQTPCYAENDTPDFNDLVSMGGPNLLLAIRFVAPSNLTVFAMETFTGEQTGTNSLGIWSHDVGSNEPDVVLSDGTWSMSATNSWQGAALNAPVVLTAGDTYWVVWGCQNGSQAAVDVPMATLGQVYRSSFNGGATWSGPFQFNDRHWKFRLYCQSATTYCTAKTNLVCGVPSMRFNGVPSATATSGFVIEAAPARQNRSGLVLYSQGGRAAIPFQGGTLCVNPQPALRRTVSVSSGGASPCDGVFGIDMNSFAQGLLGGSPDPFLLIVGQQVNGQWWGRDSVATGSFLSDGIEYDVGP